MAGTLASAQGVSSLAKALVQRVRPPEAIALIEQPGSFSLPSGHAFLTLVFLGLLVLLGSSGVGRTGSELAWQRAGDVAARLVDRRWWRQQW